MTQGNQMLVAFGQQEKKLKSDLDGPEIWISCTVLHSVLDFTSLSHLF